MMDEKKKKEKQSWRLFSKMYEILWIQFWYNLFTWQHGRAV